MSAERYNRNNSRNNHIDPVEKQILRTSQTIINKSQHNQVNHNQVSNNFTYKPVNQTYNPADSNNPKVYKHFEGNDLYNANSKVSSINQSINEITKSIKKTNLN